MLSIDEVIKKHKKLKILAERTNDKRGSFYSSEEHEQIAEWLEELKCYKNDNDFSDYADRLHKIAFNSGYNKALDDFVNTVKATFPHDNIAICNTEVIAEQLKEGEQNE